MTFKVLCKCSKGKSRFSGCIRDHHNVLLPMNRLMLEVSPSFGPEKVKAYEKG